MSMCDGEPEEPEPEIARDEFEEGSDEQEPFEPELKDKYAFGLQLDPETGLPRVTAMGRGRIAQQMLKKAKEAGTTVEKDPAMVKRMFKPTNDRVIPSRTYQLIAEILTFIYQINEAYTAREVEEVLGKEVRQIDENEEVEEEYEYEDIHETGEFVGEENFEEQYHEENFE